MKDFSDFRFIEVKPDYKKQEFIIKVTKKRTPYHLPFSVFDKVKISSKNNLSEIKIETDFDSKSVSLEFKNGYQTDFHLDFVLYHCEPTYVYSPMIQVKNKISELLKQGRLSRKAAANLKTSRVQLDRLLDSTKESKSFVQLYALAKFVGCRIEVKLVPE